ncbi:MAG: hypothetical protein HKO62_07065, partial [Gammaproteobacteria bacterium]|nr:hypothetical protein [Gammaproteobacteria bacterium]
MPDYLLFFATLSCAVFGVDWLTRNTRLRYLGSALGSLIAGAVLVNCGLLPSAMAERALYSGTLSIV